MNKIFIVDAVNYLFRSYYAISAMTNDKGQSTNALYGFIRSLLKLKKDFCAEYMVAVFDGPDNKKSRREVYADYKMHRKKAPDDLYPQFELAYHYCELAGIPAISLPEVEADDTMATMALWAKKQNFEVYLCTSDKDLYQLVCDEIFVLKTRKENLIIDKVKVKEKFGVRPEQMLDLLAIMGDASDNIPGIAGFGPKTAASLLNKFDTLDGIYHNLDQVKGKKQTVLKEQKALAYMSKDLATLQTDIDIPQNSSFYHIQSTNTESLENFFREMKFFSLLKEKQSPELKKHYQLINSEKDLHILIKKLKKEKEISLDTETTSIHPLTADLVGVGLCTHIHEGYYIPTNGNIPLKTVIHALQDLIDTKNIAFVGHNFKYDYHVLSRYGLYIKTIAFDTILASYLINPHNRRHNLDRLALENLYYTKIPFADLIQDGKKKRPITDVPLEKMTQYCCEDVDITLQLKELFEKKLEDNNLTSVFKKIEMPLLNVLIKMEAKGIFIDKQWFDTLSTKLTIQLKSIQEDIFSLVGKEFNLNSPKQLSEILYEDLQLPTPRKKTSDFSTAAKVLAKLAKNYPIAQHILNYRTLQKLLSTYIDTLPKQINPHTGRIHATFNQSITATGRLSCQNPNLQNIPIRSAEGKEIRKGFRPEKSDWSYLAADYSQIELRILAHFSEDPNLLTAFNNNEDIHTFTASLIFDVSLPEVTKQMRHKAKAINFGILYGQGAYGLSEQLNIPIDEAALFIKKYFNRYPKIQEFIEKCKQTVEKTSYATTLFGRKRPIPDIHNKNQHIKAAAQRLAINTPLQGTNADLIKLSMIEIQKQIDKQKLLGFMILQIHDELIFEVPDEELEIFSLLVKEKMQNIYSLKVPLLVDIAIGKNWGEC